MLLLLFFVVHMFRMTLFFVIAGFFGRMLLQRLGVRAFVRNRGIRIGIPLVVGWVILFPLIVGAIIIGAVRSGITEAVPMPEGHVPIPAPIPFPLTHLWFLYLLILFYAAALIVHGIQRLLDRKQILCTLVDPVYKAIMSGPWAAVLLAVPVSLSLYNAPYWSPGGGIPTPDQSLIPNLPAAVTFGLAFTIGWMLHRQIALLKNFEKSWAAHFAIAVVMTVVCCYLDLSEPLFRQVTPGWRDFSFAVCYGIGIWSWTIAILGFGMRYLPQENSTRRYIADASYWIYLTHLPLIFFLQLMFMKVNLHWTIKFPAILTIALAILFLSYHYLVRNTFIGKILNGRRYPRKAASPMPALPVQQTPA